MIKAVMFDLDGTLLNRDLSVRKFISAQHKRLSNGLRHVAKEEYTKRFIELDCRGYVWKDKVYQQLVDEFNIDSLTWEYLLEDYLTHFKYSCVSFPNLIRMLEDLKSKRLVLGMITNGKRQFQMDNIKALGIEKYFDTILVSDLEGLKKPDSRIFEKALQNLNVSANESVFVGDHPEKDVNAAQNVGMKAVWKKDLQWDNVEADYIINDLSELPLIHEIHSNGGKAF